MATAQSTGGLLTAVWLFGFMAFGELRQVRLFSGFLCSSYF